MTDITGNPKIDATHYGDRPDNKATPPKHVEEEEEHTAGSEHHPARNGRHLKSKIDHAIELDDAVEELKHDIAKENQAGNVEKARELDRELTETMKEQENLDVKI